MINPKTGLTFVRKLLMSFPGLIVMALLLPKVPGIAKGILKSFKKKPDKIIVSSEKEPDVPDQPLGPLGPREPMGTFFPFLPLDANYEAKEIKK